jgi:hypothetical protein
VLGTWNSALRVSLELSHTGKKMNKIWMIDRENNLYVEIIRDIETGQAVRCCIEPLSDHINHGSAKVAKS